MCSWRIFWNGRKLRLSRAVNLRTEPGNTLWVNLKLHFSSRNSTVPSISRHAGSASGKRGRRPLEHALCSQPRLSRLLAALAQPENREGLRTVLLELARRTSRPDEGRRRSELVLDLDSLPLEVFGHQPGSAWNGRCRYYHPVVVR